MEKYIYINDKYEDNYNINKEKIDKNYSLIRNFIYMNFILIILFVIVSLYIEFNLWYFILVNILQISLLIIYFIIFLKMNKKFQSKENDIFEMEDFYDYYGYNNSNDNRVLVPSPIISTKMEVNRGNIKGKLYNYITNLILVIVVIVSTIFLNNSINAKFNYDIGDIDLKIKVDLYNKTIDYKDIEDMEIRDDNLLDSRRRIVGNAMKDYNAGKYNVDEYGNVWLFIRKSSTKYILLKTNKGIYIFNDTSKEKTERLYNELNEKIATMN